MQIDYSSAILCLGRLLIGGAFVFASIRNISNYVPLTQLMNNRGVPRASSVLWLGICLQLASGTMIVFGICIEIASALLLLFLIAATPMFHNFWDCEGPDRAARINGFVGNVALAGSFITIFAQNM